MLYITHGKNKSTALELKPRAHVFDIAFTDDAGGTVAARLAAEDLLDYARFQYAILSLTGHLFRYPQCGGVAG